MSRTHIYFLLDRTGSMASMAGDVIGGFNGFLREQREEGDDALMTLVQFDSVEPFEVLVDAAPLSRVRELTPATFQPRGSTPLLDATGTMIVHASVRAEQHAHLGVPREHVLFVTFTDGEENCSRRYTRADVVRLVRMKQELGWTFVFLGAGLDAYAEGGGVGYAAGSTQAFAPSAAGAKLAFDSLSRATSSYRGKLRRQEAVDTSDFFEGQKPAEDHRHREQGR